MLFASAGFGKLLKRGTRHPVTTKTIHASSFLTESRNSLLIGHYKRVLSRHPSSSFHACSSLAAFWGWSTLGPRKSVSISCSRLRDFTLLLERICRFTNLDILSKHFSINNPQKREISDVVVQRFYWHSSIVTELFYCLLRDRP